MLIGSAALPISDFPSTCPVRAIKVADPALLLSNSKWEAGFQKLELRVKKGNHYSASA
jgi:hypothetical protein